MAYRTQKKKVIDSVKNLKIDTMKAFGGLDLTATAGVDMRAIEQSTIGKNATTGRTGAYSTDGSNNAVSNTTINLNGDYSFRDKTEIDYFMNKMELAVRRA